MRANADHAWLPPRALGASAIVEEDQTPFNTDFCYDDQDAAVHPISSGLPDHLTEQAYQCYSLYVGRDGEVFVLNYNAHERSVWNGTDLGDDNSDHVDGGDLSGDWCTLSFRHLVDSSMSDASYDAPEASIIGRRPGQVWVDELLPQLYHGNRAFSDEGSEGGLVGDIALLIGLIALSIPTPSTGTMLPGLIQHYWIPVPAAVPALRASALQARMSCQESNIQSFG